MPKITEELYYIPGQDEFMPDSHAYVLGEPSSQNLSLIDAGLTGKGSYKIQSVQRAGIELSAIKRIIMTHTHLDHIGCLGEILKQIPWAELWMHRLEADLLEQGDERAVYGMDMFRGVCQEQFGIKPGAFKFQVNRKLQNFRSIENCREERSWILVTQNGRSSISRDIPWAALVFIIVLRKSLSPGMSFMRIMRSVVLIFMGPMLLNSRSL